MLQCIDFVTSVWNSFIDLLDRYTFNLGGGVIVGIFTIMLGFLAIALVVKVFWKGA